MGTEAMTTVYHVTAVRCCRDCPNYTNNAQLHDDPFTSAPADHVDYCKAMPKAHRFMLLESEVDVWEEVHKNCPLREVKP